ncbi:hypothetical protein P3T76_005233 [Phytophthora citrophthora]|uniref:Uncharacterized protein n=1 Tax=Phytophthora citrophthora TaxID=4793 RepID=A0AAD9LQM5_9STRA|nr:hypothetical protein P3T76_005233 [Phytophthora citrophthora]
MREPTAATLRCIKPYRVIPSITDFHTPTELNRTTGTDQQDQNAECQVGDRAYWRLHHHPHRRHLHLRSAGLHQLHHQQGRQAFERKPVQCRDVKTNDCWKYIQYPQAVTREEYYRKMREVAREDK